MTGVTNIAYSESESKLWLREPTRPIVKGSVGCMNYTGGRGESLIVEKSGCNCAVWTKVIEDGVYYYCWAEDWVLMTDNRIRERQDNPAN